MQKAKIFISYSRADSAFALELAEKLRASGLHIWIDRLDIVPGQIWDIAVEEALESSEILLVILSPTSVVSKNVRDEVSYALDEGKEIVPALHLRCKIPFRLRRLQFADFTDDFDRGFAQLMSAVNIEGTSKTEDIGQIEEQTATQGTPVSTVTEDLGDGVQLELVSIPGGEFTMGSPDSEHGRYDNEGPQHQVTVSPFYMGKYEVTQAQWRAVATNLSEVKIKLDPDPSHFKGENLPIEQVSWEEAIEFCDRLSKATGKKYRLPTEAEWEYACRAGTTGPYAGSLDEIGWYGNNSGKARLDADEIWRTDQSNYYKRITDNGCQTHAVGQKKPNAFGLYDMHGNVWEWCMDWYSKDYYSQSPSVDPRGPSTGSIRVRRGGCWGNVARRCRSASRGRIAPDIRFNSLGFRLVRTLR